MVQFLVDSFVFVLWSIDENIEKSGSSYVFEWRWLPVVLLPEVIVLIGFSLSRLLDWHQGEKGRHTYLVGVTAGLALAAVFSFPWVAHATNYAVLHGLLLAR